jgi:hypothetical protein
LGNVLRRSSVFRWRIGGGVAKAPRLTERREWFGTTIGLGGRRKFGGALAEGREGVGEKPRFSQRTREMGHPATAPRLTERQDWFGTTIGLGGRRKFGGALAEDREGVSEKPHFSQRTREMGHPALGEWGPVLVNEAQKAEMRVRGIA